MLVRRRELFGPQIEAYVGVRRSKLFPKSVSPEHPCKLSWRFVYEDTLTSA